jgi:hypothetical protein
MISNSHLPNVKPQLPLASFLNSPDNQAEVSLFPDHFKPMSAAFEEPDGIRGAGLGLVKKG